MTMTQIPTLNWHPAKARPDADMTVIVHAPSESEPVWLGYFDGKRWRSVEGVPIRVTHWTELPEPPTA